MAEGQQVLSFGCRLNIYESEVIKGHLPEGSNTLVVNTCAVTSEAERQARQATRRAHRENPEAGDAATGCAAGACATVGDTCLCNVSVASEAPARDQDIVGEDIARNLVGCLTRCGHTPSVT